MKFPDTEALFTQGNILVHFVKVLVHRVDQIVINTRSKVADFVVLLYAVSKLEEILKLDVDVIHGPIREEDMIEVKDEVVLYAA